MRCIYMLLLCFFVLSVESAIAQRTEVTGSVVDETGETLIGVNIVVKGTVSGTITDIDGTYKLSTAEQPPFTLVYSSIGYTAKEIEISQSGQEIDVVLAEQSILGDAYVKSASRVEENILQSPVTVEKLDALAIRNTPSSNFYDAIENLKGVQMNTNSLTFKSVNTRGFASFANVRFVQQLDGMDNAAPGLNFPAGNLVGMSELDVSSVELLPGASSALYGANAFNGILLMGSKNPFTYQGLSAYVKGGVTSQQAGGTNPFIDVGARYARAFNDKFAFKLNVSYIRGTEWWADDYSDMDDSAINAGFRDPNNPLANPSYDGVNIYGDEIATTINLDNTLGLPPGTQGNIRMARTGYEEEHLTENIASSIKFDAALHYKITDNLEASYTYRGGIGNSVYQGANRYGLKDISLQQHKLEFSGDNYFVRAYTTLENSKDSYDMRFAAWNINRRWKDDTSWFLDYVGAYLPSKLFGNPDSVAHAAGREAADAGRFVPGTQEFEDAKDEVLALADLGTGSKFTDKTKLFHVETNYNFKNQIDFIDLQVGASWRQYLLNSNGTIFNDFGITIPINEYGAYLQAQKTLLEDRLKLTASVRFDKNENFEGQFSPRASIVYSLGEKRQHNIRTSFQTGFRNPDTQSQFIALDLGVARLIGGTEQNIGAYAVDIPYTDIDGDAQTASIIGDDLYNNSYTAASVGQFDAAVEAAVIAGTPRATAVSENQSILRKTNLDFIQPEKIQAFEIGYKGVVNNKLVVDVNFYHNWYTAFQANTFVRTPLYGNVSDDSAIAAIADGNTAVFQLYSNANDQVTSYGAGLGLNYALPRSYKIGVNYSYADLTISEEADPDLVPGFNTPNHKIQVMFGNRKLFKNFGFNINYRWSDGYDWQASFGNGPIDSYQVVDLQMSYKVSKLRSIIKLGAANLLNQEYRQAFGASKVGGMYYISFMFDELLN